MSAEPGTDQAVNAEAGRCPHCGAPVEPTARFCEACGAPLTPTEAAAEDDVAELPVELTASVAQPEPPATEPTLVLPRPCASCGGVVGADGYCETCGTKAPSERDHYVERPASWVAACCDRGIRHHRNEDATAVAASAEPGQARRAGGLRRGVDRRRVRRGQHGRGQARPGTCWCPPDLPVSEYRRAGPRRSKQPW